MFVCGGLFFNNVNKSPTGHGHVHRVRNLMLDNNSLPLNG